MQTGVHGIAVQHAGNEVGGEGKLGEDCVDDSAGDFAETARDDGAEKGVQSLTEAQLVGADFFPALSDSVMSF